MVNRVYLFSLAWTKGNDTAWLAWTQSERFHFHFVLSNKLIRITFHTCHCNRYIFRKHISTRELALNYALSAMQEISWKVNRITNTFILPPFWHLHSFAGKVSFFPSKFILISFFSTSMRWNVLNSFQTFRSLHDLEQHKLFSSELLIAKLKKIY